MSMTPAERQQRIDQYERGPRRIHDALHLVPDEAVKWRPAPGKWSIAEILAHLADAELVVGFRLRLMLASNGTPIQAFDQDAWAETFSYNRRDPRVSIETFSTLRKNNLRLLTSVPRRLWENYGQHSERGKETVDHVMRMMAGHDLNHLQQLEKIAKG